MTPSEWQVRYYMPNGTGGYRAVEWDVWAPWFETSGLVPFPDGGRLVGLDALPDGVELSTQFLGIDQQHGSGPPLVFETLVIGGPHAGKRRAYSTLQEAQQGHAESLAKLKGTK